MKLRYVGAGFLPGVPARDLSAEEVEEYGGSAALLASGLYVEEKVNTGHAQSQDGKKGSSK